MKSSLAAHGYECLTVQEAGWAGKSNGELLSLAETAFEVFVTLDTNLRYQQNLAGRRIAVIVMVAASNRLEQLSPLFPACAEALNTIKRGDVVYLEG